MVTSQILEKIRAEIITSGRDTRFKLEAYSFVLRGLDFYHTKAGERRHFTGNELAKGFLEFAHKQFGPIALLALNSWGITKSDDFGYIVYNLIDIKLIRKQEGDSLEDFYNVIDIPEYLSSKDTYAIDRSFIKTIKGA